MSDKFKFESSKEKQKIKIFPNNESIDQDSFIKGARLEIYSNKQITIEGCYGVFEYDENYIKLNLGKGSVILTGSRFDIVLFENKTITIKGNISSLEFCI